MARRYRYEYLMRNRAKERAKMEREERLQNLSSSEKKMRELFGWVAYIVVLVCIVHLTVTYVGQRTVVAGDSMLNTLHDKDNLIVDKVSYRFRDPERYEIIVFPYRHAEEPITLGVDEYFVLGDNRNESADSREISVGILKRKDLIGRAWVRIWPLDSFGSLTNE